MSRAFGRDPDVRRDIGPTITQSVADQVREDLPELDRVGHDPRQVPDLDRRARGLDRPREIKENLREHRARVRRLERPAGRGHAGKGEQILDLRLHPGAAVDDEVDILARGPVEPIPVPPHEELRERDDRPERLLKIVAGNVREPLEILVGALQLGRELLEGASARLISVTSWKTVANVSGFVETTEIRKCLSRGAKYSVNHAETPRLGHLPIDL